MPLKFLNKQGDGGFHVPSSPLNLPFPGEIV